MNLPRAVREQAERADAAHLALLGKTVVQTAPQPQVIEPPADPIVEQVTPAEPVVVPPIVEATPAVADSWELKYRVLAGKYDAEVPRSAKEIRELKAELALKNAAPAPQAAPAAVATPSAALDSVREQYGEDFASAVETITNAATAKLRDEFSSKVEVIEVDTAKTRRQGFLQELAGYVPTYGAIDSEPGFTRYLDEVDAFSGRPRREFFNEADQAADAPRVALFFASYLKAKAPAPVAAAVQEVPSAEHLLTPDSSRAAEAPLGKKVWTKAEVNQFYASARSSGGNKPFGAYTAAEYARIDADISAAPAEGRYIG